MPPSNKPSGPASIESRPESIPDAAVAQWEGMPVDASAYLSLCRVGGHVWLLLATMEGSESMREVHVCDACGGRMQFDWSK